jgi:hypothetical protein
MLDKWIPCRERMPKSRQRVILYVPVYGEICCDYVYEQDYKGNKGNSFFSPYHSGYSCIRDATHWMPLPEPPKGIV